MIAQRPRQQCSGPFLSRAKGPVCGTFRTLAADARMAGFDGLRQVYAVAIRRFAASELKLH